MGSFKWLRSVIGLAAGAGTAYAGGLDWKHVLSGLLISAFGIVTHLTSQDPPAK